MHGAKAFKDFIDKKNTRVPEFLEVVAEHQEPNKTDSEETTQDGRKKSRAVCIAKSQFGSFVHLDGVLYHKPEILFEIKNNNSSKLFFLGTIFEHFITKST